MAYQPLGLSGGYLEDAGQHVPRQNALLRSNRGGQFSGFDDMGPGWFKNGKFRDLLGRGTVTKQIDLGPMATNNSMLQYNNASVPSDNNQFKFF